MASDSTMPAGNATSGTWPSGAGVGRPLPEARLVDIGRIRRARPQPRAWFDPDELENLAASIREHGILAPLIVRPDPEHAGEFILVVGERRLRAARALGLTEVPVLIRTGVSSDDAFVQALVENLQRADLTADERYNALKYLEGRGLSQREIGRRLGYDHTTINRHLRIHEDPVLGPAVATAQITPSQGQELLRAPLAAQGPLIDLIMARRQAGRAILLRELRAAVQAVAGESLDATAAESLPRLGIAAAPVPPGLTVSPPDWSPEPEGSDNLDGRELRRMVVRAGMLVVHVRQELEALLRYVDHPEVAPQLHRARQLLAAALPDPDASDVSQ